MTTELIANSPTPGTQAAIATLGSGGLTSGATSMPSGTGAPPAALQSSTGQFRMVIDSEIIIGSYSSGAWGSLTRGAEGSTAASHSGGASIYHDLTAAALTALIDQSAFLPTSGGTMSGAIAMGSNKITGLTNGSSAQDAAAFGQIPTAGSSTPNMDGTGSAGSAATWSKSDHTHPTDTSRAPVASPTFTGTPAAPTPSANDNSTKLATTAYVDGSYTPTTERVNSVGTSGSAQTIPAPQTDTINRIVLSANCTLTFPSAAAGKSFMLQVVQPASGGPYSVTWPGSGVVWVAGSVPTQATGASKRDLYSFVCIDGTNWEGIRVSPSGGY